MISVLAGQFGWPPESRQILGTSFLQCKFLYPCRALPQSKIDIIILSPTVIVKKSDREGHSSTAIMIIPFDHDRSERQVACQIKSAISDDGTSVDHGW